MLIGIARLAGAARWRGGLLALWCLVAVGCAEVTNGPAAAVTAAESEAVAAAAPATEPVAEAPFFAPVAELSGSLENSLEEPRVATEPDPPPPLPSPEDIAVAASEPTIAEPPAPASQELELAASIVPSSVASPSNAETLDFSSLVTRLRKTKAINLRTKVAVKSESDDLLEQFRAYHTQTGIKTLTDLRRSYDSLFYRLHSLLEDADPPLARDIDRSRAAIWELLANPSKFNASQLVAGA